MEEERNTLYSEITILHLSAHNRATPYVHEQMWHCPLPFLITLPGLLDSALLVPLSIYTNLISESSSCTNVYWGPFARLRQLKQHVWTWDAGEFPIHVRRVELAL